MGYPFFFLPLSLPVQIKKYDCLIDDCRRRLTAGWMLPNYELILAAP